MFTRSWQKFGWQTHVQNIFQFGLQTFRPSITIIPAIHQDVFWFGLSIESSLTTKHLYP